MAVRRGWRLLGGAWAGIFVLAAAGVGTLAVLGPPVAPAPIVAASTVEADPVPAPVAASVPAPAATLTPQAPPPASTPDAAAAPSAHATAAPAVRTTIAPPDPALLVPATATMPGPLPRIGADGRAPRQVYAAPAVTVPPSAARVALLISGFGLSERESRAAIDQFPSPVSFAVSAYAAGNGPLLDAARQAGHELLASIPMEPLGYPQFDEGARSLRTGLGPEENRLNLAWALSRTPGAVGATGASDGLRGERFADIPAAYTPVLEEVGRRGLLYVDARPGRSAPPGTPVRSIDVVLDEQVGRAEIDAKLGALERTAKERGGALGLAGPLRPATIERIAAWTKTLAGRGMVLVPVSALVNP